MFARDPEREDDLWSEPVVPPSTGWASPLRGAKRSGLPGAGQARLVVGTCVTITWATLELRCPRSARSVVCGLGYRAGPGFLMTY